MTAAAHLRIATPSAPGAVAIIELVGEVEQALARLTGRPAPRAGTIVLRNLDNVDEGVVARVADEHAWIMPHGGPRVVQQLAQRLAAGGVQPLFEIDPVAAFPEASSHVEALALAATARAASPLAVDLLLDQPHRWEAYFAAPPASREGLDAIRARSALLNRLVTPPLVVIAGRPNAGKSTLANALLGREVSITSDQAGTTRDYLISRLDLRGLVVNWCDTPGRHETDDPIEAEAIDLASSLVARADLVIAAAAPGIDWPDLDRSADLHIDLKADLPIPGGQRGGPSGDLRVSAATGAGLEALAGAVMERLVPQEARRHAGPWLFDDRILDAEA